MKKRFLPLLFISVIIFSVMTINCSDSSGEGPDIETEPVEYVFSTEFLNQDLRKHIAFLASDGLGGREAGTSDEDASARYIADLFSDFGLDTLPGTTSYLQDFTITFSGSQRNVCNVVGYLPGTSGTDETVIIGAHYDHLGLGSFGSLYTGSAPMIHNGADDNASGTSGLLELAHYFSENRPKKNLLFIAFSGEEMGLFGSVHYVNNPLVNIDNTLAMINMDMIGRLRNNDLVIFGMESSEPWEGIVTSVDSNLNLLLEQAADGASDHASFNSAEIPVLHYHTELHPEYHHPADDIDLINFDGIVNVLTHLKDVVFKLDGLNMADLPYNK